MSMDREARAASAPRPSRRGLGRSRRDAALVEDDGFITVYSPLTTAGSGVIEEPRRKEHWNEGKQHDA